MGLDMYAYVAARAGQQKEYWDSIEYDQEKGGYDPTTATCSPTIEIAYWRKHPNLHGWFEQLYRKRGGEGDFNGDELELTREDIDRLEQDVIDGKLPATTGFFFGDEADSYYYNEDLAFIKEARAQLFLGLKVFYNSSW